VDLILQTEKEALKFRLIAVLLASVGLYFARLHNSWEPVLLVLGYLVYAVFLRSAILPRVPFPLNVYGMIVVDIAAVSLGLLLGGRIGTALFVLFPALILYYSIHLGYASSLASATLASLAYPGITFMTGEAQQLGAFVSFQVPLFYLLAIMGGFIAQKRLEERRQRESLQETIGLERGARSLLDVTKALSSTLEIDVVLDRILASAISLAGMEAGMVALLQRASGVLEVRASTLKPEDLGLKDFGRTAEAPEAGSLTRIALETLQPQFTDDAEKEAQALPRWLKGLPYRSLLILPVVNQGRALGVLYLLGQSLKSDCLATASGLSDLAGIALSNASLYEESQARVSNLKEQFGDLVGRVERLRSSQKKKTIHVDGLQLDLVKTDASIDGRTVSLSPVEFELLRVLAENAGEPLAQDTLLRLVWGPDYEGQANVVDVSIHRLRRKVEDNPSQPKRIVTVRGAGYMLSTGVQGAPVPKTPLQPKKVI